MEAGRGERGLPGEDGPHTERVLFKALEYCFSRPRVHLRIAGSGAERGGEVPVPQVPVI